MPCEIISNKNVSPSTSEAQICMNRPLCLAHWYIPYKIHKYIPYSTFEGGWGAGDNWQSFLQDWHRGKIASRKKVKFVSFCLPLHYCVIKIDIVCLCVSSNYKLDTCNVRESQLSQTPTQHHVSIYKSDLKKASHDTSPINDQTCSQSWKGALSMIRLVYDSSFLCRNMQR